MEKINNKLLIVFIVFIVIIAFILHFKLNKGKSEIKLVEDNSNFFTVSSCVSKFIDQLASNDTENVLILIDSKYKKKYNIDSNSIYSFFSLPYTNCSFKAKKMYYEKVGKYTYKYYVYGVIMEDTINNMSFNEKDYYIIVYLNEKNMTFSVEPYEGDLFNS